MIDLNEMLDPAFKDEGNFHDVREHKFDALKVGRRLRYVNVKRVVDPNVVQLLMVRLPLPKVIMVQQGDIYEIVKGHEVVNTLAAILHEHGVYGPRWVERRIEETEVTVVVVQAGNSTILDLVLKLMGV
jgi:hypothetical protein